jgi:hypothetical protein
MSRPTDRKAEIIDSFAKLLSFMENGNEHLQESARHILHWTSRLPQLPVTKSELKELYSFHYELAKAADRVNGPSPSVERARERIHNLDSLAHSLTSLISGMIRRDYCRKNGLKVFKGYKWCAHKIAGVKCPTRDDSVSLLGQSECTKPPAMDHWVMFKRGSEWVLTSQPYAELGELMPKLKEWADHFGLNFRIVVGGGWHYPGGCLFYEVFK